MGCTLQGTGWLHQAAGRAGRLSGTASWVLASTFGTMVLGSVAAFLVFGSPNPVASEDSGRGVLLQSAAQSVTAAFEESETAAHGVPAAVEPAATAPAAAPAPPVVGDISVRCTPGVIPFSENDSGDVNTCTVASLGGFAGTVSLSCSGLAPRIGCRFSPSAVQLSPGSTSTSRLVVDWERAAPGSHDFKVIGTSGPLTGSFDFSFTQADPSASAPPPRDYTAEDYAGRPFATIACNPPPGAAIALERGQSTSITCTFTSVGGFSQAVLMDCTSQLNCVANPSTVTPPPNGSVQVVYTISVPDGYQPPLEESPNVAIIPFRNELFVDPGRLDYLIRIPRLPTPALPGLTVSFRRASRPNLAGRNVHAPSPRTGASGRSPRRRAGRGGRRRPRRGDVRRPQRA
jgi:hypothetical protein